jgi:hypothetical protein
MAAPTYGQRALLTPLLSVVILRRSLQRTTTGLRLAMRSLLRGVGWRHSCTAVTFMLYYRLIAEVGEERAAVGKYLHIRALLRRDKPTSTTRTRPSTRSNLHSGSPAAARKSFASLLTLVAPKSSLQTMAWKASKGGRACTS